MACLARPVECHSWANSVVLNCEFVVVVIVPVPVEESVATRVGFRIVRLNEHFFGSTKAAFMQQDSSPRRCLCHVKFNLEVAR